MNWATNVLQWKLQKEAIVYKLEQIYKSFLSSDCGLKLARMKLESLVIVDQHATVNMYLGLVHTARHMPGVSFTLKIQNNQKKFFLEFLFHGEISNWDEVVTR